ncbi:hypothetical protein D3C73_1553340 [compost metagenome]
MKEISSFMEERLGHQVILPRTNWLEFNEDSKERLTQLAIPIGLGLRGNDR